MDGYPDTEVGLDALHGFRVPFQRMGVLLDHGVGAFVVFGDDLELGSLATLKPCLDALQARVLPPNGQAEQREREPVAGGDFF